jgi:hypothetical protein
MMTDEAVAPSPMPSDTEKQVKGIEAAVGRLQSRIKALELEAGKEAKGKQSTSIGAIDEVQMQNSSVLLQFNAEMK